MSIKLCPYSGHSAAQIPWAEKMLEEEIKNCEDAVEMLKRLVSAGELQIANLREVSEKLKDGRYE